MIDVKETYKDLAEWADIMGHPDKLQFDALLSVLVHGIFCRVIEDTREEANSGTEHIDLIKTYVENQSYEQFFTTD